MQRSPKTKDKTLITLQYQSELRDPRNPAQPRQKPKTQKRK